MGCGREGMKSFPASRQKGRAYMKRNILLAAAFLLLFTAGKAFPAFAAASWEEEVTNRTGIGDVSIRLEELELDAEGNEIPYINGKTVLPGQRISKIVRITNEAEPAWIRAKLQYVSEDGIQGMSDGMVSLASEQWVRSEEYYYYTVPIGRGGCIDFIREVRIPPEWDGAFTGKSFSVIVTADAVQRDHFTPDFTAGKPWFGMVIETCVHAGDMLDPAGNEEFFVVFEGGAQGLISFGENFFSNWGRLMPGDTVSDKVRIKNSGSRPVTVYFRAETIADDMLLKQLELEINSAGRKLYSGTMDGAVKKVALASLRQGEEEELTYRVHVPEELNNRYALAETRTKWIFSAELEGAGGKESGGGESGRGSRPGKNSPPASGPGGAQEGPGSTMEHDRISQSYVDTVLDAVQGLPRTGDSNVDTYALLVLTASGAGIWALWKRERKERHE